MRGSNRAGRNPDEPTPSSGVPYCPPWLDDDAKRTWRLLTKELRLMKILTKVDRNALARYCQTFSRWRQACEFIMKNGEVYPLKNGDGKTVGAKAWPQVKIANQLADQLLRLEREFGLTPAARSRLTIELDPAARKEARQDGKMSLLRLG